MVNVMDLPEEEFIYPGTRACAGCGMALIYRMALKALGEKTIITDTNFFDTKYNGKSYQTEIPKWWKITTKWLLQEKISESEYLRAMENLITRNILKV